ncbi:MAG TPA: PTS cellobiose transporter subunit IIA, partial [Staphylococcus sp.]|nr:PTS cellobiose transporter subunit IIA [Staphylococcus sp.]
ESELNLLLIHSQDHLMNAITVKDLANEMIDLYKEMKS